MCICFRIGEYPISHDAAHFSMEQFLFDNISLNKTKTTCN